ncbi:membrane fusion protein, multidrug efflux system [Franzmannia pantelleriensis]|uniref:Membrane fusion protein, multidrug efflux system n=1 Tax=Franzmannia pantelleriensis TaxID=48727 RepID=A0A1G9E724_9GAMM|nr:efflux RND transporter periplasmic adaptor subunit [Halomonas pantelleriensis]SDK71911.1 membrane fusion protein, multidrug efflux system [Halomonas pantelleriensis]
MKATHSTLKYWVLSLAALAAAPVVHAESLGVEDVSCLVEPGRLATLSSQLPGVIDEIQVAPGESVSRGDTLFTLKREVEQASRNLELARAEYAARRLQRNQRMIEQGMLSDSEADELNTDLRVARLQGELAAAQFDQRTSQAPFDGVITQQHAEEGEYIDATPVLELAQLDPLQIEAVLPLAAYGTVAVGDVYEVALASPVERRISAEVSQVDSIIDASSGTFVIQLRLDNPDGEIPAGINCRLS